MTTTTTRRRAALATICLLASLLLAACSASDQAPGPTGSAASSAPPAYRTISEPTLRAGDPVPAPEGKVVLRVSGSGQSKPVAFDMATLERLGLVEYAVDDKQAEGRRVTFRGVLMSSLLEVVGASDATMLHTKALNDYGVDIPAVDVLRYPVLLATQVDGQRMSVERYGPTRVVYPTDAYDLDPTVYDPRWIWQLASIEVE